MNFRTFNYRKEISKKAAIIVNFCEQNLFPLIFSMGFIVNVILYYAGLAYIDNVIRSNVFIASNGAFSLIVLYIVVKMWRKRKISFKNMLPCGLILLFFAGCFLFALFKYGFHTTLVRNAGVFVVFGISAILAGNIYAVCGKDDFIVKFENIGLMIVPIAIIYFLMQFFHVSPFVGRYIGVFSYMNIAYGLMPFAFASILAYIQGIPGYGSYAYFKKRIPHFRRCYIVVLLSAIFLSDTRGTILCCFFFIASNVVFLFVHRRKIKRAVMMLIGAAILYGVLAVISSIDGGSVSSRMEMFVSGLLKGELVTSNELSMVNANLDAIVNEDSFYVAPLTVENNAPDQSVEAADTTEKINILKSLIFDRGTLFRIALKEIGKNPVFGLGPMGYTLKYGLYPHNIVLEMLCDLGIPLGGILMVFVIACIVKLGILSKKSMNIGYVFLFLCGYIIQAMASGSLWDESASTLFFGFGYFFGISSRRLSYAVSLPHSDRI